MATGQQGAFGDLPRSPTAPANYRVPVSGAGSFRRPNASERKKLCRSERLAQPAKPADYPP
jgi:hypothetical protein